MRIAFVENPAIHLPAPIALARAGTADNARRWSAVPIFTAGFVPAACFDGAAKLAAASK
jgi:hypothetical protein